MRSLSAASTTSRRSGGRRAPPGQAGQCARAGPDVLSLLGADLAGYDAEQRGLSAAVAADQADAGAGRNKGPCGVEQLACTDAISEIMQFEHCGAISAARTSQQAGGA